MIMKLKRRGPTKSTTGGTGTATTMAVVGLSLSWLISPARSLSPCHSHSHRGHYYHSPIDTVPNQNLRHPSQTEKMVAGPPSNTFTTTISVLSRNHHHHHRCRRAFSRLREDEREDEMELTNSRAERKNDGNVDATFNPYEENTMLLDTMMMASEDDTLLDDIHKVDGDEFEDDDNNKQGFIEKRQYDHESPCIYPSPPRRESPSSSANFSGKNVQRKNNDLTTGGSYDANTSNPTSNNNSSSGGNRTDERRPSNRRMQVFAYLSKPIVEVRIICLVLLSCFLQAITTLDSLPPYLYGAIDHVDTVCVYIFATEFFARWWSAGRLQLRYLARPLVCIDAIVVILPLILNGLLPLWDFGVVTGFFPPVNLPSWLLAASSANSALLNLRLLRILKFQRVLTDETTYMNFELALGMKKSEVRPYQLQLARVVISIFTLVSVSTGLIYSSEHEVNPQIPDYFTALYFGLTTLTTVGFGDISPVTVSGRFVVGASILAGVAIIPAQAANLAEAYLDFMKDRAATTSTTTPSSSSSEVSRAAKKQTGENAVSTLNATGRRKDEEVKNYCSACGAGSHRIDARFCWSCGKALD